MTEVSDAYIWHNYSALDMTPEELEEMRWKTNIQISYVFTQQDNEKSLAETINDRWSKEERDFSWRPLEWY
jgi:hypothetical protein